jgi:hypothetical protein
MNVYQVIKVGENSCVLNKVRCPLVCLDVCIDNLKLNGGQLYPMDFLGD